MTAEQEILDGVLHSALEMFRLTKAEQSAIFAHLEELKTELVKELSIAGEMNTEAKREAFIAKANKKVDKYYNIIQEEIDFNGIGTYVGQQTQGVLQVALGIEAAKMPTRAFLNSLNSNYMLFGAPSAAWWQGQNQDFQFRFAQQVRQGLLASETNQQIISRIVGSEAQPGVMHIARRNAAALVQTSVQAVANDARRNTFLANDDVVKGIKQVSTLDSHTSLICISYSGCEWLFKDGEYKPTGPRDKQKPYGQGVPRHWNCRSVEVPITKTFEELGFEGVPEVAPSERASEDGPVPADTTFDGFLKRKGKAYQDNMLGAGRADLWRQGKITLRDLVDANGRPLTLDELRAIGNAGNVEFFTPEYLAGLAKKATNPAEWNTYEKLREKADEAKPQFDKVFGDISKQLGLATGYTPKQLTPELALEHPKGFFFAGPIKDIGRATEKVMKDYKGDWTQLNDMVRGTVSVSSLQDVKKAIDSMRASGIDFVTVKDKFANPTDAGYRDIMGIVRLPNGLTAEMQFHVTDFTIVKNHMHELYDIDRTMMGKYGTDVVDKSWSAEDAKKFREARSKQITVYNDTWYRILRKKRK